MAKKKERPPEEGSPAWMTTFSDLMNLLLCFFVLLFASSTVDEGKIQKIADSFENMSFSILPEGAVDLVEGEIISGGVTQLQGIESIMDYVGKASKAEGTNVEQETATQAGETDSTNSSDSAGETGANSSTVESNTEESQTAQEQVEAQGLEQSVEMYDEIQTLTESYSIEDKVEMDYNSQYVELDVNGALLFDSGEADLKDEAKMFMQKIASILLKYKDCVIEIEGHTDNIPVANDKYESNRYLSTARANKVYEYIMAEQSQLIDSNIKIAGYGESRPIASNDSAEGRARNRRVSIKIYNQIESQQELQ